MRGIRIRHHVNPLRSDFVGRPVEPLALPPGREVEVELGCAEAQFLFERAAVAPAHVFVGLEIREDLVAAVNRHAAATGAPVQAVFTHVNEELDRLLAPGAVTRLFVNFPDPWFKRRHHKRRVMDADLVDAIAHVLRPDGELLFQSDIWDLAIDALALLEGSPRFRNEAGAWSFWKGRHPYGARSKREEWCEEHGEKIWRLRFRRT